MNKIKIIGAGGGGCNTVRYMSNTPLHEVEYYRVNIGFHPTDNDSENFVPLIGDYRVINGRGFRLAYDINTSHNRQKIESLLSDSPKLLIITLGLSGHSTPGIADFIGRIAKEKCIPVIIVATLPFTIEGSKRRPKAEQQLCSLKTKFSKIVAISADSIFEKYPETDLISCFPTLDKVVAEYINKLIENYENNIP